MFARIELLLWDREWFIRTSTNNTSSHWQCRYESSAHLIDKGMETQQPVVLINQSTLKRPNLSNKFKWIRYAPQHQVQNEEESQNMLCKMHVPTAEGRERKWVNLLIIVRTTLHWMPLDKVRLVGFLLSVFSVMVKNLVADVSTEHWEPVPTNLIPSMQRFKWSRASDLTNTGNAMPSPSFTLSKPTKIFPQ